MADPAVYWRVTFHFNYRNRGFSETYFRNATDMVALIGPVQDYLDARLATQPPEVTVGGVRITQDGKSRFGRTFLPGSAFVGTGSDVLTIPKTGHFSTSPATAFDRAKVCMQMELTSGTSRIGFRYFDLIPDEATGTEPGELVYGTPPLWWDVWKLYRVYLRDSGWLVKVTAPTDSTKEAEIKSWSLSAGPGTEWQAVLQPETALTIPTGRVRVAVRGVRQKYSGRQTPNGRWDVKSFTADTGAHTLSIVLAQTQGLDLNQLTSQGKMYVVTPQYVPITNVFAYSTANHKRGGPFPRSVGRRKILHFPA